MTNPCPKFKFQIPGIVHVDCKSSFLRYLTLCKVKCCCICRLIVLLLIRKGLLRVLIQTRRLVRLLEMSHNNTGGDTIRRDKEYLR